MNKCKHTVKTKLLDSMSQANYQRLTIVQIPWSPSNFLIIILLPMLISLMRKIYDDHVDASSSFSVIIIIISVN